jgi:hypothetical protein
MDTGSIAVSIPIVAILAVAAIKIARIRSQGRATLDPDTAARLSFLEEEVGGLRQALGETQERLDFAERLLAQARQGKLGS